MCSRKGKSKQPTEEEVEATSGRDYKWARGLAFNCQDNNLW